MATENKTTTLTQLMQTYYDKLFLDTPKKELRLQQFAQMRSVPKNSGKIVYFTQYTALAGATTALTEGSNPAGSALSATTVSATLAGYGDFTQTSDLVALTAIDAQLKEKTEIFSQQSAETIETLIANQLSADFTSYNSNSVADLTAMAATDTLDATDIKKVVRALKVAKAQKFSDGYLVGVVNPYVSYDLQNDSEWIDAQKYGSNNGSGLYDGEIGKLGGVRFVEATETSTQESSVTLQHTYIFGKNSFGAVRLSDYAKKIMHYVPGTDETSNPLNMFSTYGWKLYLANKVLNDAWGYTIRSGYTA